MNNNHQGMQTIQNDDENDEPMVEIVPR